MNPDLAEQLRDALIDALVDAYDDAGLRGLCGEGRWEAAVGALRALPPELILQRAAAQSSSTTSLSSFQRQNMTTNWKPENYSTVSPYLIVNGAESTIDFLVRALGAERIRQFPAADGKVMHAEVRIGDTVLMIADGNESWAPAGAHVHIYLQDVDAAYRRALDAGAESVQEPVRKEDADKRGGVRDAGGTTWWIATKEL